MNNQSVRSVPVLSVGIEKRLYISGPALRQGLKRLARALVRLSRCVTRALTFTRPDVTRSMTRGQSSPIRRTSLILKPRLRASEAKACRHPECWQERRDLRSARGAQRDHGEPPISVFGTTPIGLSPRRPTAVRRRHGLSRHRRRESQRSHLDPEPASFRHARNVAEGRGKRALSRLASWP